MTKADKENRNPLKLVKRNRSEKIKRAKMCIIQSKRKWRIKLDDKKTHGKKSMNKQVTKHSVSKHKKKILKKKNLQSSTETALKEIDNTSSGLEFTAKGQEVEKKTYASQLDYLNSVMHKSLHNIVLTPIELQHLYIKYKQDGHYRVNANLPTFENIQGALKTVTEVPNRKVPFEYTDYDYTHEYQYSSMENLKDHQFHTELTENNMGTHTFMQTDTSVDETYKNTFSNTYILSYNNANTPNSLQDSTKEHYSNNINQLCSDSENPYNLSNRTSCSSMSDSDSALCTSNFRNSHSPGNSFHVAQNIARNSLNDFSNLRNQNFIDTYIPPINPPFTNNCIDWLNTHNDSSVHDLQSSTIMENHLKQNSAVSVDINQVYQTHFYNSYNNETDMNQDYNFHHDVNNFPAPFCSTTAM